ncbi:MAG: SCO family protein, partial [Vicinamibacterales bacterium]
MRRDILGTLLIVAVALLGSGCGRDADYASRITLPFYDSVDFTPRWTESVDHEIGEFALVTQAGERITRGDLHGRLHVASFIFTSCNVICPTLVTQLSKVQDAVAHRDDVL